MKQAFVFQQHLALCELTLPPAGEWAPNFPIWSVTQASRGLGYWMGAGSAADILPGSIIVCGPGARGRIRASQIGELALRFFCVDPDRLGALLCLSDQLWFKRAANNEELASRVISSAHHVAQCFARISAEDNSSVTRLQMLQVFLQAFGDEMKNRWPDQCSHLDGKGRLRDFLDRISASELTEVSLTDLAQKTHCAPRHVRRLFQEVVGQSFREKQTELRLTHARELLATSQAKVLDVALESGYGSLTRFNLLFKRHFGVTPTQWRQQVHSAKPRPRAQLDTPVLKCL